MKPIVYALQFRGYAESDGAGLRKVGAAPGSSLEARIGADGLRSRFVWEADDREARFESVVTFLGDVGFVERGTILFARGHLLRLRGTGELGPSADPALRHGSVVWEVEGGEGQFAGATGRITSNFFLSTSGELTDHQLGVVFTQEAGARPAARD